MVFIIPREWWGARPPKSTPFKIKTPTPELWLHHAAGAMLPGDDTVSPIDYQRIRAIQNFHMDVRGWNDIAYSWLVDTDGYVFEGRGPGIAGGHTAGHNTVSHAICVMGNYDLQTPDPDLAPRVAELVRYTHSQGWTPKVFTGGHRDVGATSCPGNKLYPLLPEFNRQILEDDMSKQDALDALTEFFGNSRVVDDPQGQTLPDGSPRTRRYVDALVDSTWHATAGTLPGKNPAKTLDFQTRSLGLSETELAALAAQVIEAMAPGIRAAVAAELKKLTMKAV